MKRSKVSPKWWLNVINDITRITASAQNSFKEPGVVLEISEENDGVAIRLSNGTIGFFKGKGFPKLGDIIQPKDLPEPNKIIHDQDVELLSFITGVIQERVNLIPKIWLNGVVSKLLKQQPVTIEDYGKRFPEWVLMSTKNRSDKELVDLIYRATSYEGLRGLMRFKDKGLCLE